MKNLSQILLKLTYQDERREYDLLRRAIEEAVGLPPAPLAMDALFQKLADAGGGYNPDAVRRSLTRAVDGIWEDPDVRRMFSQCGFRAPSERPAPEDFISAMAHHLREQSRQTGEPPFYEISVDSACGKYGLIVRSNSSPLTVSFPALTDDLRRLERIVRLLCQYRIPPEAFKDEYLSGRPQRYLNRSNSRKS